MKSCLSISIFVQSGDFMSRCSLGDHLVFVLCFSCFAFLFKLLCSVFWLSRPCGCESKQGIGRNRSEWLLGSPFPPYSNGSQDCFIDLIMLSQEI